MQPTTGRLASALLAIASFLPGQQVRLDSGETIDGSIDSVLGSKAKVRTTDGKVRQIDVRTIAFERKSDGTESRHAATLATGEISPPAHALLARMAAGEALAPPEVWRLTEQCTASMIVELTELAQKPKTRAMALAALARSATKEGVRAAVDVATKDGTGHAWREVAPHLLANTGVAALASAEAITDVEKALAHKDRPTRFAVAWIATKLGCTAALPVLTTFLQDSDHHLRESAATCLAEAGDAGGAKLLLTMVKREKSPAMDANRTADAETKALVARGALAERVRTCELLGRLRFKDAVSVLTALQKHADPALATAARYALAAMRTEPAAK